MITHSFTVPVDGSSMPCYLARPDGDAPRGAVIVLQEIFGVNAEVRRIADLVAGAGYVALAPNYYHRTHPDLNEPYTPDGLQAGFAAAGQVNRATLRADLEACRAWLGSQPFVAQAKIATWGFCFGGSVAFLTATMPGIAAAIAFYGGSIAAGFPSGEPEAIADAPAVRAPLFLAYGGKDAYIPADAVDRTRAALERAGATFEIHVYPDQDHAFFRESSNALDQPDVADAWRRVQAFLEAHIG